MSSGIKYTIAIPPRNTSGAQCLLRLLILSKDRMLWETYCEAASALGYSTVRTENPDQALHLIGREKLDAVLLELAPPAGRLMRRHTSSPSEPSRDSNHRGQFVWQC